MKKFLTPPRLLTAAFFVVILAIGLLVVDDYGVSWDELSQLEIGTANYRFLARGDPGLFTLRDRYYGPLFEIFLVRMMDQSSPRAMYLSRHMWTFLSFYVGLAAFYALGRLSFKNEWLALLGSVMLALSPRIFADSFYNSKDIPFLSASIFAALTLLWYLKKPGWTRLALHALFSAALIGIRFAGIYILGLTAGMLLVEVISRRMSVWRTVWHGLIYILLSAAFCLLFYPVLWSDVLGGLKETLQAVTNFPYFNPVIFMGKFISPQELPWTYLPVWIGITTPPVYLALMVVGSASAAWALLRRGGLFAAGSRGLLLALAWGVGPLAAVIALRPVLYDGWRQMFFIYPGLILLAVQGAGWLAGLANRLPPRVKRGSILLGLVALLAPVLYQMASLHPYQNVYFNRLAGSDMQEIKGRFDLDYWGLSYRKGLEYILSVDGRSRINVFGETPAGVRSAAILGTESELRLHFVDDMVEADYFLGNYRWHPQDYSFSDEIHAVRVGNAKILSVFRLRTNSPEAE